MNWGSNLYCICKERVKLYGEMCTPVLLHSVDVFINEIVAGRADVSCMGVPVVPARNAVC